MTEPKTGSGAFAFDPPHVTELQVEHASDRPIPADWPCQIVRRAAKLMKERAYGATCGPWVSLDGGDRLIHEHETGDGFDYVVDEPMSNAANAEHIAALDPVVADLIADAWEHQADDMSDQLAHASVAVPGFAIVDEIERTREDWTATVRAALAYLREAAPKAVRSDG